MLQHGASELLRQEGTADTGLILRGCADLSGSGDSADTLQKVWNGETGRTGVVGEQSFLHKAICLLRGSEMPGHDDQGCGKGTEARLAHGQETGERIHAGAVTAATYCSACGNRNRRNIHTERTYLSDYCKRSETGPSDLVRRGRPV